MFPYKGFVPQRLKPRSNVAYHLPPLKRRCNHPSLPVELTRLLLVAYVASYHALVYPDRTDIVPARPQGPVPSGHLLQLRVVVEQLQGALAFQIAHDLRHGILRRYPKAQMYMVAAHRTLDYPYPNVVEKAFDKQVPQKAVHR